MRHHKKSVKIKIYVNFFLCPRSGREGSSEFYWVNWLLFPLKSSENLWFAYNLWENRSPLIRLNSLNIRSEIWRELLYPLSLLINMMKFLFLCPIKYNYSNMNTSKEQETGAVDRRCSVKRVFYRRNPFISKVLACNYIKRLRYRCFPVIFEKFWRKRKEKEIF